MKKLLGLIVLGVAVKLLLDSEKGDQIKAEVKRWWGKVEDVLDDVMEKAFDKVEDAGQKVDDVLPSGKAGI